MWETQVIVYPHFLLPTLFFVILLNSQSGIDAAKASSLDKNSTDHENSVKNSNNTSKSLEKILARIHKQSNEGPVVVLFCKHKCLNERAEIFEWIRKFNSKNNNSELERGGVSFLFQYLRHAFPPYDVDAQLSEKPFALIYIVSNRALPYKGSIDKTTFLGWLSQIEESSIEIIRPQNHTEIDEWLGKSREYCNTPSLQEHKFVVVVHHVTKCRLGLLKNIARAFHHNDNVTIIEIVRPLTVQSEVILRWRLTGLSHQCLMIIVIHNNAFIEVNSDDMEDHAKLYGFAKNWTNVGSCNVGVPRTVNSTLNDIQIQYLSEEFLIKNIETNRIFILVGTIGGIAVIALAISIFWGLNGTSFVSKN